MTDVHGSQTYLAKEKGGNTPFPIGALPTGESMSSQLP